MNGAIGKLLVACERMELDLNWMGNNGKLLNPQVFDYFRQALENARADEYNEATTDDAVRYAWLRDNYPLTIIERIGIDFPLSEIMPDDNRIALDTVVDFAKSYRSEDGPYKPPKPPIDFVA